MFAFMLALILVIMPEPHSHNDQFKNHSHKHQHAIFADKYWEENDLLSIHPTELPQANKDQHKSNHSPKTAIREKEEAISPTEQRLNTVYQLQEIPPQEIEGLTLFEFDEIEIGANIAGLEVIEFIPTLSNLDDEPQAQNFHVSFAGDVALSGHYVLDGPEIAYTANQILFELDETSRKKLPVYANGKAWIRMLFSNQAEAKKLLQVSEPQRGPATIQITSYSVQVAPSGGIGALIEISEVISK